MTPVAVALLTYLWHYLLARAIFDELVRPLAHGHASGALLVCVGVVAFALGRTTRRRARPWKQP